MKPSLLSIFISSILKKVLNIKLNKKNKKNILLLLIVLIFIINITYFVYDVIIKSPTKMTIKQSQIHYNIRRQMDRLLLNCNTVGVFTGWLLIEENNIFTQKFIIYFDTLRGIWNNPKKIEDTKISNPFYELPQVLDYNTIQYFNNIENYKQGVVLMTEKTAFHYNLKFLITVYNNLDLKREGVSLEEIYLKPIFNKKNLIWVLSLSFVKSHVNGCHDPKGSSQIKQALFLNNLANFIKNQYQLN